MHRHLNVKMHQILAKRYNDSTVLGVFVMLHTVNINFVMSVRPSVRPSAWKYPVPSERIVIKFETRESQMKTLKVR